MAGNKLPDVGNMDRRQKRKYGAKGLAMYAAALLLLLLGFTAFAESVGILTILVMVPVFLGGMAYNVTLFQYFGFVCLPLVLCFGCYCTMLVVAINLVSPCVALSAKGEVRDVSICEVGQWRNAGTAFFNDGEMGERNAEDDSFEVQVKNCRGKYARESCAFDLAPIFAAEGPPFVCAWAIREKAPTEWALPVCGEKSSGLLCGRWTNFQNLTHSFCSTQGMCEKADTDLQEGTQAHAAQHKWNTTTDSPPFVQLDGSADCTPMMVLTVVLLFVYGPLPALVFLFIVWRKREEQHQSFGNQ